MSSSGTRCCGFALIVASSLVLTVPAGGAHAQSDEAADKSLARSLFREGVKLAENGKFQKAADRFRRARELHPSPALTYNLASALDHLGQLVEASELLRGVVDHPEASSSIASSAEDLLEDVEERIAHLTVHLEGPDGVEVYLDERELAPAALGVDMPVDPGPHELRARKGSQVVSRKQLQLQEGSSREVTLTVPGDVQADARAASRSGGKASLEDEPAGGEPAEADDDASVLSAWWLWTGVGIVVAGGVVTGLAVGGVFDGPQPIEGNTMPGVIEWR